MAKLSKKEQEQLEALQAKAEAPDRARPDTRLSIAIDLGDPDQVSRAQKLGLLDSDEDDDDGEGGTGDDDDADPGPSRRGYFKDE